MIDRKISHVKSAEISSRGSCTSAEFSAFGVEPNALDEHYTLWIERLCLHSRSRSCLRFTFGATLLNMNYNLSPRQSSAWNVIFKPIWLLVVEICTSAYNLRSVTSYAQLRGLRELERALSAFSAQLLSSEERWRIITAITCTSTRYTEILMNITVQALFPMLKVVECRRHTIVGWARLGGMRRRGDEAHEIRHCEKCIHFGKLWRQHHCWMESGLLRLLATTWLLTGTLSSMKTDGFSRFCCGFRMEYQPSVSCLLICFWKPVFSGDRGNVRTTRLNIHLKLISWDKLQETSSPSLA